ncbi:MAG: hypothetical protein HUU21_12465 [Polyangiaceae bacterium]|nr:hypothetical protein [Polyangiaceae bacterium]
MSDQQDEKRWPKLYAMSNSGLPSREESALTGQNNAHLMTPLPIKVGVNYPWRDYACDIGILPRGWRDGHERAPWRRNIATELAHLKDIGIFAVRWFLFADGLCLESKNPSKKAQEFEEKFALDASSKYYASAADDFAVLLDRFREADLLMMPVIADFLMCHPAGIMEKPEGLVVKQGRQNIVTKPEQRKLFRKHLLAPILKVAAQHKESIYAIDIFNEPELCFGDGDARNSSIVDFISECANDIHQKKLKATVGFQRSSSFTTAPWARCVPGLDLLQYHYYPYNQSVQLKSHGTYAPGLGKAAGERQCVVGEFATRAAIEDWPALGKAEQTVWNRLHVLAELGYPAVFPWSIYAEPSNDEDKDRRTCWNVAIEEQIKSYVSQKKSNHPPQVTLEQCKNDCSKHASTPSQ